MKKITQFENNCYQALKTIPAGKVISYKALAQLSGHPNAYRAVGSAMNKNPFAPKVPCHRVVSSDGKIGGFAKGIKYKIQLLKDEGVLVKNGKIIDFENKIFIK